MTLKQARKRCGGYTQKELADLVGVSVITISNWETGKTAPTIRLWKKIADVLGIAMQELEFEAPTGALSLEG